MKTGTFLLDFHTEISRTFLHSPSISLQKGQWKALRYF